MKVLKFTPVLLLIILSGCIFGTGGPSDSKVEEILTRAAENAMDPFCTDAEVTSVKIIERDEPYEFENATNYPITASIDKKCSSRGAMSGGEKTETKSYRFWRIADSDKWKVRLTG